MLSFKDAPKAQTPTESVGTAKAVVAICFQLHQGNLPLKYFSKLRLETTIVDGQVHFITPYTWQSIRAHRLKYRFVQIFPHTVTKSLSQSSSRAVDEEVQDGQKFGTESGHKGGRKRT